MFAPVHPAYFARMDSDLTARLDRFERYFELMQEQHLQVRADIAALDRKTDGLQQQLNMQQTQLNGLQAQLNGQQAQLNGQKSQLIGLQAQLFEVRDDLRTEMRERFESVDEQLRTLTRRVEHTDDNVLRVQQDLAIVKGGVVELHGRVDALGDDMRQRFRGVNERLGNLEKRNVA
jgi:chromosome segregation ATPase